MSSARLVPLGVRLLMALSFGLLAAGAPGGAPAPADLTVDFVSDLKGSLEHCGCTSGKYGGVSRRLAFLEQAQQEPGHRLLVAGGDCIPAGAAEERIKGVYMLEALRMMKYDAIGLGDFDFAHGPQVLLDAIRGLPVVTTNLTWSDTHKPLAEPMIIKKYVGIPSQGGGNAEFRVAVLSFMDERMQGPLDFYMEGQERKLVIRPVREAAQEWVPKARKKADVVVVLMHMNSVEALKVADDVPGMDVVVGGHSSEETIDPPRRLNSTVVVANGDRGRYVGELRYNLDAKRQLSSPVARQLALDEKVGEDSLGVALVARSKLDIAAANAKAKQAPGAAADSAGPKWAAYLVCTSCHQGVVDSWRRTPHAQSYDVLVKAGSQDDDDCLKCHVMGYRDGGFKLPDAQPMFSPVQCESCHGPAVRHSTAKAAERAGTVVAKPDAKVCLKCHDRTQSPDFNFSVYWERIKH